MENQNSEKMPDQEKLVVEGVRFLVKELIEKKLADDPNLTLSKAEKSKYEDLLLKIMLENKSPLEAMGFSDEMLEHMYAFGHRLYNNGNYKKAKDLFSALMIFHPDDARFFLGQAACYQRLGDWENAAAAYETTSMLDPHSPMPLFYKYECLNQLNRYEEAEECLKKTIVKCGKEELFENIKERCQLLLNSLSHEQEQKEAHDTV